MTMRSCWMHVAALMQDYSKREWFIYSGNISTVREASQNHISRGGNVWYTVKKCQLFLLHHNNNINMHLSTFKRHITFFERAVCVSGFI